ncbi:hypothetical protein V496_09895 [Pseudogymnoascus sp. VKM F-4515 (FW-2607)]|nr:hypothetical protein V496_09895 [Pseudogymnoascus sp. VKM F-4515 (FW-2607)]KFY83291.1 hypothetical protein V498_08174 [Pseudogymnoascus sp. VKM F-4517 (FW-2822)]
MKFSVAALALVLSLAVAAPAPELIDREATSIAENVVAHLQERGMLEARACPKNSTCSGGKCWKVYCVGGPGGGCSRYEAGGSC